MISRIGKNKGFLLLEVMMSVAILSIGLVLILASLTSSLRATELSEDYFRAGLLLEEKIYEVSNSDIAEGSSSSTFTDFDNRFSWNLGMLRLEEEAIYEVDLEVSWNQGKKEHDISILTYL